MVLLLAPLLVAALTAVACGAATVGEPTAVSPAAGRPTGVPSDVTWPSGAGTKDAAAFGGWRGRPVAVWPTWNDASTWSDMRRLWTLDQYESPRRFAGRLSFAQPLLDSSSSYAGCVAGDYDDDFAAIASGLVGRGWGDAYVRLGWEMNGDDYRWKVGTDYAGFRGCFTRAAAVFKRASPAFAIEWNPSATQTTSVAALTYPGDAVVDVVGADFYDGWPASVNDAAFDAKCGAGTADFPIGLCRYAEFARAHGKRLSVPEWGIRNQAPPGGGGDNPLFIRRMAGFFAANADILAYEAYFDLQDGRYQLSTGANPRSAAAYTSLFGR